MTNLLSFDKILYHPEHIMAVKKHIPIFPVHATISLGNFCNHKCLWCTASEYQLKDAKMMDFEKIVTFLEKAVYRGLKAVTYVGNGEPTVYPKFKELVSVVAGFGLEQGMFTNGFLVNRYETEILENFTWIRVSLDAGSTKVHNKMHDVSNHFETIIDNISQLVKERKNQMPTIGVQYALHQENLNDLYESAQLSKACGVDYFSIKPVFNRGSVGERIERNRLSADEITPIVSKIKEELQSKTFFVYYRPHQVQSIQRGETVFDYKRCVAAYFNIHIYEDERMICCGPNRISGGMVADDLETIEKNILKCSTKLDLKKCPIGCRYHELNAKIEEILHDKKISKEKHINFI